MQEYDVIQSGYNPKYPIKAKIWSLRENSNIPDWLTDRAKIKEVTEDGKLELETRQTSGNGIEILESGGRNVLVRLNSPESYILFSETHPLISVTPHQLELLYELHLRK